MIGMIGLPGQKLRKTLFSLSERKTKRWWKRFHTLSHRQKVLAMRELYADHHIELSRPEVIFSDMRRRLSSVGIFSLSECNDNELMWAHYGGNHSGIAIGFGRNPSCKLGDARHTLPVTYHLTKPTFAAGFKKEISFYATPEGGMRSEERVSFEDDVFRSSISTKTPPWSYECEWRYVEETNGLFDWPGPLVSVVFGLRMKKERRRYYRKLIEASVNESVDIFEVQVASTFDGLILKQL